MKFLGPALLLAAFAGSAFAGSVTFLTSPGSPVVDTVNWSGIGADGTLFSNGQTATSVGGNLTTIGLGTSPGLGGLTSVVCDGPPATISCSWPNQPSGYSTGDTLIWLEGLDSNSNPVGTGPLTLTLTNSVLGLGEYIQATAAGQFSASLSVYNGNTLLGSQSYTSDSGGDPLFLGATDTTADISTAVLTVTACGSFACDANDFSADTLQIYGTASSTPEPATFALGGVMLAIGFAFRKRMEKGNN